MVIVVRSSGELLQAFLDVARSLSLSRALVASSRIRIGGFLRKTRAMEIRCFWPPESLALRARPHKVA